MNAAGQVLTGKQAPGRPGIAPRLVKQELEDAGFHMVTVDEQFTARGSSRKALVIAEPAQARAAVH